MVVNMISAHITDISRLIEQETDTPRRTELMLQLHMMQIQKDIAQFVADMKTEHNRRITDTEQKVDNHSTLVIRVQTGMKIFSVLWVTVSGIFVGVTIYGYTLVSNLRDMVIQQSAILPRVEQMISNASRKGEGKSGAADEVMAERVEGLRREIDDLKKLRVIKGSR